MPDFLHLHCHTQYSLLDGASDIANMMDKAKADGQKGVALTDHGNMFGAFQFVAEANKRDIKPIVGCEFYLVEDRHVQNFSRAKGEKDVRYHQLMLAKNQTGYQNLSKLCSLGFIEGQYGKYPRIDKELIVKYHEGLIATSCCIGAEIPQALMHGKDEKAEELLKWWLDLLGDDFYIELQRHRGLDNIDQLGISQEDINQKLLALARKHNVKTICTNDAHYIDEEDAAPHDILLCINTGERAQNTDRFKFPSSDFYFKTQAEMNQLFADVPESIDYTQEIYDKIEPLELARDVLLPNFPMPKGFETQDDYLRHLTYEGAKRRYGTIRPEVRERLDFELDVIKKSGYPGYFLIVQDFTTVARKMGVSVGPGRGSAAGSAVAYCVGITNVDPIKYDLLFERFLNPERISMPDIDIDFDDVGRQKVIDYVIDKYGRNQVAQIITYGSMKAKSAIRDVGRVMDLPLSEVDKVAKSVPDNLKTTLKGILEDKDIEPKLKSAFNNDDRDKAYKLRELSEQGDEIADMIARAKKLEGSVRNTGIHACGVVITPDDITKFVPVTTAKDSDMLVSQFDNNVAEDAGLLKMDFLGLKTLTIIKDAVRMVRENHGVDIDPDEIPLDDEKTYQLFQRGETIAIFQYESGGMQKHMKALQPSTFEDIIAMNALYRPGPMEYIPEYVERRHGRKPIKYDLPAMEEYLSETYGITVFQEQIMLLSQKLANFSKGEADTLRKAMGKKKKALLDKMFPQFVEGCKSNGHPEDTVKKIWTDWEAFASYAFNKSHSTCYALIAFHTAYLKAHYPAEFMAAVLTNNKGDLGKMTGFLRECRRMGVPVLGPDINESQMDFSANKKGQIRFGMSALKGVGEGPVEEILRERSKNGPFESIFDVVRRCSMRAINKRVLESLVLGGAFDFNEKIQRSQYFATSDKYDTLIEHVVRYGNAYQLQHAQAVNSLFGASDEILLPEPSMPVAEPWSTLESLTREKEVTGIFISGHPLDDYKLEVENFTNATLESYKERQHGDIKLAGIVAAANKRISKSGNAYGFFTLQDFDGQEEFRLFGEDYAKWQHLIEDGRALYLVGNYRQSWRGELELKFKDIRLLEEIGKEKTNKITLQLPIERITPSLIDDIEKLCASHKGKQELRVLLIDVANQQKLDLVSKKRKVSADHEFIGGLERLGVEFRVN